MIPSSHTAIQHAFRGEIMDERDVPVAVNQAADGQPTGIPAVSLSLVQILAQS